MQMQPKLIDSFGRTVNYLRLSVTDRCDFRCVYCMSEEMTFMPRAQILTLEEIYQVAKAFTELGVTKLRVTGGEPLIRRNILELLNKLGNLQGLDELVMTTNGSHLDKMAQDLKKADVKRLNISLDTLNPERFKRLTRTGDLQQVLRGIVAAKEQGFERIKLNAVILKNRNHDEVVDLVRYAVEHGFDISFIEEMPLGQVSDHSRAEAYYPSYKIREDLAQHFSLSPTTDKTGGPSNYFRVDGGATRVGFISPHSENFCSQCNRVRLTAEGRLLLCLGNEDSVDLKKVLRSNPGNLELLKQTIVEAMKIKPEKHEFNLQEKPVIFRHMNVTGG
ncbi:MAG TPA: GTP 3',8-cyclase MoaA [Methylococcaceae bacterium]|nr:GTP 3',8-cyclase MoaA [Methylococcaceae bacterium]HIN68668.1 GTP 3',8-cyclase MoaA [Methylococcales bacterium]HIA45628.1 GTP 3',8-cyclase MoaA [Methylococcaceae bacterium]HIB63199.1 GTP 3',8-cyclase MoaA [Methylococcaceae bacterium]HIO12782.1 GTP 3',8-cyclase MoaA [Methylococcales bacterium]